MPVFRWSGADLELAVHAQPGAKKTEAAGAHGEALKIRVRARAIEGAANEALLEFLADALGVPRKRCVLLSGETSRHKRVLVQAPDRARVEEALRGWLQTSS
jgi:uncharacterized protein (TIGR00251 family)